MRNVVLAVRALALSLRTGPAALPDLWAEQSRTLRTTSYLFAALGLNSIALILMEFRWQVGPVGFVLGSVMTALYVFWVWFALRTGRHGRHRQFLRTSIVVLAIDGALWGALVCHLSYVADVHQHPIVASIMMCLVSVPMLGAPFAAAMAFWLPMVIAVAVAIGLQLQPFDAFTSVCIGGYALFTFGGIVAINKTLLERSIGRVRLQHQNETISLLLRDYEATTKDCLWETDEAFVLIRVPGRLADAMPLFAALGASARFDELFQIRNGDTSERIELASLLASRAAFRDVTIPVEVAGEVQWWCLSGRPMIDDLARFVGYKGVASDVTEAKLAEQRVHYLATHDSMTSLWNRQVFVERLENLCVGASTPGGDRNFSVVLLDLDRFKEANDNYGHAVGDSLLLAVAQRLSRAVGIDDVAARLGGDEFAVLLPGSAHDHAYEMASQMSSMLAKEFKIGDIRLKLGASFGVATYPADGTTAAELLRNVDLALYAAKKEERGSCRAYSRAMGETFQSELALQSDLRTASANGDLTLAYQPIYDLQSGKVATAEALLRWNHPLHGRIAPSTFIKMAEEMGLIHRLGDFALREACKAATRWSPDVRVAVNVSPLQFEHPSLVSSVMGALADSGLAASRLELEMTESTWLTSTAQTAGKLAELAAAGIRIVLDDFGTGFSSLSCLREFRFHGLKLDGSFVRDIGVAGKSLAIVRMMTELAAEIGVTLTAEGIETREQLVILRSFGVRQGQGYWLDRPMKIEETHHGFSRRLDESLDVVGLHLN